MGNWCAMNCCCDNADKRMEKPSQKTESTPFGGRVGQSGEATKDGYVQKYSLSASKCIQGSCTTDEELCDFLQQNIEEEGLQCVVVISPKASHAYRLPEEEATTTGIQILSQLIMANQPTMKVFHLNRQKLDADRAPIVAEALSGCTSLEAVDFYDNGLANATCKALWDALKQIPTMKDVNFGNNDDVNHEARDEINTEAKEKGIEVVF